MAANHYWVLVGLLVGGSAAHADVAEPAAPPPASAPGWTFAFGPYVWASSVAIDVSFGPLNTGVDIGFVSLVQHTRYGAEVALEARHGRFGITADVLYGAAAIEAATEIASVMTSITGTAGSLLLDSLVGYDVLGGEDRMVSLEARAGVRYQRTTVQGQLGVAGFALQSPEIVDDGADLIAGARAAVRPTRWLQLAGAFDIGVVGASQTTWSTTVDASVRLASWFSVAAGWRSLTMQRSSVSQEMRGPRLALQFVF